MSCSARSRPRTTGEIIESGKTVESGSESPAERHPSEPALQGLYRVRYSGPQGSGNLKLVVKQESGKRFQLTTADSFGRALWGLDHRSEQVLWIDHRREVFCNGERFLLGEPTLDSLPLSAIPRVLRGLSPIVLDVEVPIDDSIEVEDAVGRQWRLRGDEEGLAAWTLWLDQAPTLWWTRDGRGGILSHRDGSQFRWRRIVEEPLAAAIEPLQVPSDYDQVHCDASAIQELRQSQP